MSEGLQFAGKAAAGYLLAWWIIRPRSYVYRFHEGQLSIRTFFILPVARLKREDITSIQTARPEGAKPLQWMVSPVRRQSGQVIFAETERKWIALPDWLAGPLANDPGAEDSTAQFRGASGYQRLLASLTTLKLGMRKLGSWCVPLAAPAAWLLILLSIWLTALDLVGVHELAAPQYGIPASVLLKDMTYHFLSSGFLLMCGIAVRVTLALGIGVPRLLAGLCLLASVSLLVIGLPPGLGHDFSHALFDSCTGYDETFGKVGIAFLIASSVIALASWAANRGPAHLSSSATGSAGLATTP
ncbi:hypothetical protein [Luteolibacter flavescens]|uniref:hypothetical protein n=1 Tax=Luteolibacter flavescens TaxID=1859460 RepID=UPI002221AF3F|nr:hypothetical protein [Luteolibacter flavescens]